MARRYKCANRGRGVRVVRLAVVGILVGSIASACGTSARKHFVSDDDLRKIARVAPTTVRWSWPKRPIHEPRSGGSCDGWRWQDAEKLGVVFACLAETDAGAHTGLAGARAFARRLAKRTRTVWGGTFTDVPLDGLGDEAWRILEDFAGGQEVTFGWRRSTLLVQVRIQCLFETCPSDIRRAGRAWADAIDAEAVADSRLN
jgi:hypothetical protein